MEQRKVDAMRGLSREEVLALQEQGLGNHPPKKATKTTIAILKDNLLTIFNLLNVLIAIALAFVGAFSNLFFIFIIILNVSIGIIQEVYARNLVEKLSLLTTVKANVLRDGIDQQIELEDIVLHDVLLLAMGDQICADCIVVENTLEVNESLLTGESDSVIKKVGDELYSGSYVISGKAKAQVHKVGSDNYASSIIEEVQKHKAVSSELLDSLNKVTKFTSYIIIPIGLFLFLESYLLRSDPVSFAVVASAAALLGMLPKGLVLLISISSATGVIKLSKKNVLVQEMHCMETLAHVDVLCLDKTGTLTQGKMSVHNIIETNSWNEQSLASWISTYVALCEDNNATFQALREHFHEAMLDVSVENIIPFSSKRKWGSIAFLTKGSLVIGAPDILFDVEKLPQEFSEAQQNGSRVLAVGAYETNLTNQEHLPVLQLLGGIVLEDPLRDDASKTLAFFQKEGVELKIISGDNPLTVSQIAKKAQLEAYDSYIDMSTVIGEQETMRCCKDYTIFGRVSPKQKQWLVRGLQKEGHCVAMTGDGVNDCLALREADCSIAMAQGNDAAKQISQLVLLDSDFASLPMILSEGRRVVNNVTKVSSVFFIKTIYSLILCLLCIASNLAFPFIPIQITLIDLAIEGYPAFFLSFEEDKTKVTGTYLKTALGNALPNALLISINIISIQVAFQQFQFSDAQRITLMYFAVVFISICAVIKSCLPLNKLRIFLIATVSIGSVVAIVLFKKLLEVQPLNETTLPIFLVLIAIDLVVLILYHSMKKRPLRS